MSMMLSNLLGIAAVAGALVIGLILYGRHSKDQTPMMGNGCNGDCAHCASHCEEEEQEKGQD